MSTSSASEFRPVLKFLFQNQDRVRKELEHHIQRDAKSVEKKTQPLSSAAHAALRDKLLSHPLETASVLRRICEIENSVLKKDGSLYKDRDPVAGEGTRPKSCEDVERAKENLAILQNVFSECLDHLVRRIENLDEKLLQLEREYKVIANRYINERSPRRSHFGNGSQAVEITIIKERIQLSKNEKEKNINLLYFLLANSSDAGMNVLKSLSPRIIALCHDKNLIAAEKLYFSLLASSPEGLKLYCNQEAEYFTHNQWDSSKSFERWQSFLSADAKRLYFDCVGRSKHILQVIFENLAQKSDQNLSSLQADGESSCSWLMPFTPVIFLNSWSASVDKLDDLLSVSKIWKGHPESTDPLMLRICNELKRDLDFVCWCTERNSDVKMLPMMLLIRDHSPLYTLYRSLPLHELQPDEVTKLLHEQCLAKDPSGSLLLSCLSSYGAFCLLHELFEIVAAGMQLDNSVTGRQVRGKLLIDGIPADARNFSVGTEANALRNRQALASFYQKNIVERLKRVKAKLVELQPLEYRIEIMENIFSLLFVRHDNLGDEGQSDSGGEDVDLERSTISHQNESESPQSSTMAISNPNVLESLNQFQTQEELRKEKKVLLLDFVEEAIVTSQISNKVQTRSPADVQNSDSGSSKDVSGASSEACNSLSVSPDTPALSWQASFPATAREEELQEEGRQSSSQNGFGPQQQSSCTVSGKSTASSIGELPRTGYLINALITWDVLLLLHDALVTTSAERYSQKAKQLELSEDQIKGHAIHNRISVLSRCVSEGLWRLQVLVPCQRKIGSLEKFDDYVDGKLFVRDTSHTIYESFNLRSPFESNFIKGNVLTAVKKKRSISEDKSREADDTSVVNFLLAPPPCLVTLALTRGNLSQAEQVIQMYKIEGTAECHEVCLALALQEIKPRLLRASQRASKVKGNKFTQSNASSQDMIMTIGLVARDASAQSAAADIVHELFTTMSPPVPTGISIMISDTKNPLVLSFLNPHSMVLTDLALTLELCETATSSLLEQALQRHRMHMDGDSSATELSKGGSRIEGFIPIGQKVMGTCNGIVTLRNSERKQTEGCATEQSLLDICAGVGPSSATPSCLMLSAFPLNEEPMKLYIESWSKVLYSICILQSALLCPQREKCDPEGLSIHSKSNKVHLAYKEVLKVMSQEASHLYPDNLKIREASKFGAYVRSFYQYLQHMSMMITNHANTSFKEGLTNYFSILSMRPVYILGSLMFQDGVDPGKLQETAKRMKLSLTSMILQFCCPKISVSAGAGCKANQAVKGDREWNRLGFMAWDNCIVMNAGSMSCCSRVYGELVVRDVLMALLSGLRESLQPAKISKSVSHKALLLDDATAPMAVQSQEVVMVLKDTTDLAAVDFKNISAGNEAVVFFINLANLMFIHAGLLNHILYPNENGAKGSRGIFSDFQLERIMAMKRVGYLVGQLGFVSLYDVLYRILQLQNPLSSILIQKDIDCRFSLCKSELLINNFGIITQDDYCHISSLLGNVSDKVSFCVTQGTPMSPRVEVLYCDRMDEQLEEAVSDHLNLFLVLEGGTSSSPSDAVTYSYSENNNGSCIATSRTIFNYLANHAGGVVGGIKSLERDAPEEVVSILKSLTRNTDVRVLDSDVGRGIALEVTESFETEALSVSKNKSDGSNMSEVSDFSVADFAESVDNPNTFDSETEAPFWLSVRVPVAVLSHLRKQCPLLAFIVQAIHSALEASKRSPKEWDSDTPDAWLNILYPPSIGVKPPPEETALFRASRNLFSSNKHRALSRLVYGNKVLSALIEEPNISSIWQLADQCLGSGTITKDSFQHLVTEVPGVINVLQNVSSSLLSSHPDILLLKDHLLVFMVADVPISEENSSPWEYAHEILSSEMRLSVVQKMHSHWPVSPAVELLKTLGNDVQLGSRWQGWAKNRAVQIQLYDEILSVGIPSVTTWQEVEELSQNDPSTLLSLLLQKKHFRLGVQWAEHHSVDSELRQLVDQSYLMAVLDMTTPDYAVASSALENLTTEDLIVVTQALLLKLSSIPTRRFLLQFLLRTLYPVDVTAVSPERSGGYDTHDTSKESDIEFGNVSIMESHEELSPALRDLDVGPLRQELMGLVLVEEVAPATDDRFQLSHLVSHPHLIIEQWLMNIKLDSVEKAVKVLARYMDMIGERSSPVIDEEELGISWSSEESPDGKTEPTSLSWNSFNWLLEAYAAKSLDTTGVQFTLKPKRKSLKTPKKFVMPSQPPERKAWIPDSDVGECSVCNVAIFSIFCRRHHCRRCGRVVCSSCSNSRMTVQGYGDLLVRVCKDCYHQTKDLGSQEYEQVRPLGEGNSDCQSQTSDALSTKGSLSWTSDIEGGWYLSTDLQHSTLVRQEFAYDCSPSLSLCLAILSQHQDDKKAAICIVKLCHKLFSLIVSAVVSSSPEVDHNFVLSMIQTLLTSSKVRFGNVNEHQGIAICEYYSQWVDLLSLMLKANCGNVISEKSLRNMLEIGELHQEILMRKENCRRKLEKCLQQEYAFMRHLRDSLVKKQLWELSLNISTKAGLEVTGIWGAWAMASLKAGDFPGAREKFARILERPPDKNGPCKASLLPEIIKYLESSPFEVKDKVLDHAERTRLLLSEQTRLPPSQALVVLHTLQNLKEISEGSTRSVVKSQTQVVAVTKPKPKKNNYKMHQLFLTECKYYLRLYGNHNMNLCFFMRHREMQECAEYLLAHRVRIDVFISEVMIPCLRLGKIDQILKVFRNDDPQQTLWHKYVMSGCRWLEKNEWWHSLLMMQEALGDRLRAVMTLLRMYHHEISSYSALMNRVHILTSAQHHLQTYLNTQILHGSFAKSKIILNMSGWQVNQYINFLALQADATKFLAGCEGNSDITMKLLKILTEMKVIEKESPLPTLLGGEDERLAVGVLVISSAQVIEESLGLAYRIVETMGVPAKKLLSVGCLVLVHLGMYENVGSLVKGLSGFEMLTPSAVDSALEPALLQLSSSMATVNLDVLVKLFSTENAKIEAYIKCGRLKSAYLVAVHRGKYNDVIRVQKAAKESGQAHVATMCTKWLANHKNIVGSR